MGGMDAAWLPSVVFCVRKTPEAKTPWMAFLRPAQGIEVEILFAQQKDWNG
jgi:hypothetical protein